MTVKSQKSIAPHYTPLNDSNTDVERTCAKLLIYPGELHPSAVTTLLAITPTDTVAIGEPIRTSSERRPIGKVNGWFLSSEKYVHSNDLRRHLDWLIAKLEQSQEQLRKLQSQPGVQMYVLCPWWSRSGGGCATLWPEQMRALADLKLECTISFADYSEHYREEPK